MADPDLVTSPVAAVDATVEQIRVAAGAALEVARGRVAASWATHTVENSRGFSSRYSATELEVDAILVVRARAGGRIRQVVRRASDLDVSSRVAALARDLASRARITPVPVGRYDVLLRPAAVAGPLAGDARGTAGYAWFGPLVTHADAALVRVGLSRHQPGQPIFAAGAGDPLTITSDGTIDFARRSAPFGDLGEPVRRFALATGGVATGVALDNREAALAGTTPNGGVRNLVVDPGPTPLAALLEHHDRPVLDVDELTWIDVDPRTGSFTASLAHASLRRSGRTPTAVTGGLVIGNVFDLLGRVRLTRETGTAGWYRGPSMRIDDVAIVG